MNPNPVPPEPATPNWTPLPHPVQESEIKLELSWSADERTSRAIERQVALMGFESPTAYLLQALAATIAGNEEDTYVMRPADSSTVAKFQVLYEQGN